MLTATLWLSAALLVGAPRADDISDDERALKWQDAVSAFAEADRQQPPPEQAVLFVGSSSIRLWATDTDFPDLTTINRGFGGSHISDVNHYLQPLVLKHRPRVVVCYAGDNDVHAGKSAEIVVRDYEKLLVAIEAELPDTQVIFLPIKPSPARWSLWPQMKQANGMIQRLCARRHQWRYVDTTTPMFDEEGQLREELYVEDGLHLSDAGYRAWNEALRPEIKRAIAATQRPIARGVVFEDRNQNARFDPQDDPLPGIGVSNGREVVVSDDEGRYELPVDNDDTLFVIKPQGYRTPFNDRMLPQFYYTHKPDGSPDFDFAGVKPTGPLPDSVDFPLYPQLEPDQFKAIFFGDPQPRNQREVDFVTHDVVEELIGTDASFGVTLGDIMFDDLNLFDSQNRSIALIGIPWYNVIGNHDLNFDAPNDELSDETFERVYGPPYYSFDYGQVHFLVLDNIDWYVDPEQNKGRYRAGLGTDQLEFIKNDLALIPEDQLIVLMMHIPIIGMQDRQDLYRLIEQRPFTMSISGHTHHHEHRYLKRSDGWRGAEPHHHVINVTVSGSWWRGSPDERGIPHATMSDGAPNGYSMIRFDGHQYQLDYKVAGRPADYQMRIEVRESISRDRIARAPVYVNVFNGSERTDVSMRVGDGPWAPMKKTLEPDPYFRRLRERDNTHPGKTWADLPEPKNCPHLWTANLPGDLEVGTHLIQVRAVDQHGQTHLANRIVRIED